MSLLCVVESSFVVVGKLRVRFSGLAVEIQQVQGHGDDISSPHSNYQHVFSPHLYRAQRLRSIDRYTTLPEKEGIEHKI
jgi:hypothetical protein